MLQNHTIIIAEAGVNHNGNFELAKKLVSAGADLQSVPRHERPEKQFS